MPPDVLNEAVDVLLERPGQARLADAGHTDHRDEAELPIAAAERRLAPDRATLAAPRPDDSRRTPELDRLRFPLQPVRTRVLVDDRRLRRPLGRFADDDDAGLRRALHP